MKVTDEMLMALADGELDQETIAKVMRAIKGDPALARRLQQFEVTRSLAKEAFSGVLGEPVPERLIASVGTNPLRLLLWERIWAPRIFLPAGLALAASIVGFVVGTALAPSLRQLPVALPDQHEIAELIDTSLSGEVQRLQLGGRAEGTFEATASYLVPDGVCRTFRVDAPATDAGGWRGVACHHGDAWEMEMIVVSRGSGEDEFFSTASDRATQSIDSFLDAMGAGEGLDAAEEERLRAAGWQDGEAGPRE